MSDWFKSFYNMPFSDVTYTTENDAVAVARFFNEIAGKPCKILDQCCGNGTIDIELAKCGHSVVGVDTSSRAIENAKVARARELDSRAIFKVGDVRDYFEDQAFDACTSWHSSCAYSEDDATNIKQFENMSRSLRDGGLFVIDTMNPDYIRKHFKPVRTDVINNSTIYRDYRLDEEDSMLKSKWYVSESGDILFGQTKLYTLPQYIEMLASVGLCIERAVGGYSFEELTDDVGRLIMIGVKA